MLCDFIVIFGIIHRMCTLQKSIELCFDEEESCFTLLCLTFLHLILLVDNEHHLGCIYKMVEKESQGCLEKVHSKESL